MPSFLSSSPLTTQVLRDIAVALQDPDLCDISLTGSDGLEVSANRFILAARSPVLKRMLYGTFRESKSSSVCLMSYDSRILRAVAEYCRSDKLTQNEWQASLESGESAIRHLVRLLQAADYLELEGLQALADRAVRRMISQHPSLACAVFDEDKTDCATGFYAQQVIECRPYVTLYVPDSSSVGGGIECLRADKVVELMKNKNIEAGELFLFRMLRRWFEHAKENDVEEEDAISAAHECSKHLKFENIEPDVLLSQVQGCIFISSDRIFDAVAKQALRASRCRVWSLGYRGRDTTERVLVEGSGSREANGLYYRIAGLANGDLFTKREVSCGQQFVYMLSRNNKDGQFQFRISCSNVLTHNAVCCLRSMQKSSVVDPVFQPVVQIRSVEPPEENVPTPIRKYYRLRISDGDFHMPGTLSKALNHLVEKKELDANSLVKIVEFGVYLLDDCVGIHISKIAIVNSNPGQCFGAPKGIEHCTEDELKSQSVSGDDSESEGLNNLYSCEIAEEESSEMESKIPRKGWKVDEQGLLPSPICTWIPAAPDNSSKSKSASVSSENARSSPEGSDHDTVESD